MPPGAPERACGIAARRAEGPVTVHADSPFARQREGSLGDQGTQAGMQALSRPGGSGLSRHRTRICGLRLMGPDHRVTRWASAEMQKWYTTIEGHYSRRTGAPTRG